MDEEEYVINKEDVISVFKKLAIIELIVTLPVITFCLFDLNQQTASVIAGMFFIYLITFILFAVYLAQT